MPETMEMVKDVLGKWRKKPLEYKFPNLKANTDTSVLPVCSPYLNTPSLHIE
ncbi:hypothetical protein QJS10_CPA06g02157 [Acorus calamus]|uniref:Uncharacterized protein n=1 Tax=Acorus calamus TaxID=4465 RepID=A0AAV9ELN3_ACOCL|nr:hypothetical protein QJS10_CPA06g02157 [Acorus calamus]